MIGQIVAKVLQSKHVDFPENCIVLAKVGWVKTGLQSTVWKFKKLTVTQILREIIFMKFAKI